ncbi:MAG: hypothetical protein IJ644_07985 [Oscillospiraceae bacterium]|nr:hypothetical protein [Oscillospiraceae bacterium]
MKKEDIQRMMSQVDEKYISELTEAEFPSDVEYADEVSGEVEVVKHISHWRNWAAAAAALIVCVGLGAVLIRPAMQRSQFEVADSAGCYDFIDSLTEEELDKYFLNEIENLPDFPLTGISDSLPKEITNPVIGKNMFDDMNIRFSEMHDYAEISTVKPGTCAVIARVWDNAPELDFSQAEAYHIDEYDVDFYGAYFQAVSEPMPASQSFFSYHGKLYNLYTDTLSKKETIRLVYEILDSDFSAKKLWLEYGMSDEDFIPYFTYAKPDVSNLDCYDETVLSEQYGDAYENSVDNIAPPVAEKYFDKAEQLFLNNSADKSAKFHMGNNEHTLLLSIYDNPQIDMNTFTTLNPYHLDDYDIDFYGLYKVQDGNPIQNSTMGIFQYHDKLYILNVTNFTRQETMKLVYEILDSDISAESLYQQYCGDIVHMEDSRITTLEDANQLEFCKGMIPQLDVLAGENEQINGRNLGADGEYVYDNLYDDSDLHLKKDTILYATELNSEQLSYTYSNAECYLHITYTSFLPDNAHLAEHYSPKITLNEPFSTLAENQDENSRLRNWDFWLDLGSCYVNLNGLCSMNQEDAFINGLNNIIVNLKNEAETKNFSLYEANMLDFCRNLVPQMTEVSDMQLAVCNREEDAVRISYDNDETNKIFNITYHNAPADLMDFAVPVLTPDQLTEEEISKPEITYGFAVTCQKCTIVMNFSGCEKSELMPYLTELKNLIEKYDSENTDLQEFSQNTSYPWHGLVPELQKIGSLEFESIETPYVNMLPTADSNAQGNKAYYDYVVYYRDPNVEGHELNIYYTPDDSQYVFTTADASLGALQEVPLYGGDGSERAFELHTGTFGIYINAVGCTQEEIDLYLNETETLLDKNYHASGAILEYLNQQEDFKDCIPEISSYNNFDFQYAVTNLTLDENAPTIELFYQDKERNSSFSCVFMKNRDTTSVKDTDIDTLTDKWITENIVNQLDEVPVMMIDCHDYYIRFSAKNCSPEDAGNYLYDLAQHYRENH